MEFRAMFITIKAGKLAEAIKELTDIFKRGPGGPAGSPRWYVKHGEAGWYDPAGTLPVVSVLHFDIFQEDVYRRLKAKGIAV